MRASLLIERLGRGIAFSSGRRWTDATRAFSESATSSAEAPSVSGTDGEPIFAACVLQRLPIVRAAPTKLDIEHLTRSRRRALEGGELKDYPEAAAGEGDTAVKKREQDTRTFSPVPTKAAVDQEADVRSMRRCMKDSLYLIVRSKADGGAGQQQGTAGANGWSFPTAANDGAESISDTAQRALFGAISRSHPVFFVGNAPMAHLRARPAGTTFFMLAQVVDDPWNTKLAGPAVEHAWVTKQELMYSYLSDPRLRELVSKML